MMSVIDWIKDHMEKIFQAIFWQNLLSQFQFVDWFTVAFILLGIVYGAKRGFLRMIAELLELTFIIFLTFVYQKLLVSLISTSFPDISSKMLEPGSFIFSALCIWFVVAVFDRYSQKWIQGKLPRLPKILGGAFVGAIHFVLIWSFISQAILLMPLSGFHKIYEPGNSAFGGVIKSLAPSIYEIVANPAEPLTGSQ